MKFVHLAPNARRVSELLETVARARGCSTPEQVADFLAERPEIRNPFRQLPDFCVARDRIAQAIARHEKILIYADYDCDGITSLAQWMLFMRTAGANAAWFVPNRMSEEYGLTDAGVKRAFDTHAPVLLIAVDCGSNSFSQISDLKKRGVDCIVLDHHSITIQELGALAFLNPKRYDDPVSQELQTLSAAGLSYLCIECLIHDLGLTGAWSKHAARATILGGIGTVADVMPLIGINRALVKQAVSLANDPSVIGQIPSINALRNFTLSAEVTATTFGWEWGPRINAAGRMDDAHSSIALLLSDTVDDARHWAMQCEAANASRKLIQESTVREACEQADRLIALNPATKVLIVTGENWHVGIVGIVAGRLKDKYNRPVISMAWVHSEKGGYWKGSARSFDCFDIGQAIQNSISAGLALKGGGHKVAAGISVAGHKLEALRDYLNEQCVVPMNAFQPVYEIIGHADALPPQTWYRVLQRLEPFGSGNPMPYFLGKALKLAQPPMPKFTKADRRMFAMTGLFQRSQPTIDGDALMTADWFDVDRARATWSTGRHYDLVIGLTKKANPSDRAHPWFNMTVKDCRPSPSREPIPCA